MATINPYLNFNGNAGDAFQFYHSIFGGDLFIQKMSEAPGTENLPEHEKNFVMHASLTLGSGQVLMASDCLESMGHQLREGNNYYLSYQPDSKEETDRIFNALADGGKIEMPLDEMFWGDYFGSLTDKFGINWMLNFPRQNTNS